MSLFFRFLNLAIIYTCLVVWDTSTFADSSDLLFDVELMAEEITKSCVNIPASQPVQVTDCLNSAVAEFLAGPLQEKFQEEVLATAARLQISHINKQSLPQLSDLYKVRIPTKNEYSEPWQCVDVGQEDGHRPSLHRAKIKTAARGLLQASLFLKKYAVLSFGKPFSPLVGFDEVQICDYSTYNRLIKLDRDNRILFVSSTKKGKKYETHELISAWRSGLAVKPSGSWTPSVVEDLGYLFTKPSEQMDYYLFTKWQKIDPMSTIRIKLRSISLIVTSRVAAGTGERDVRSYLRELSHKLRTAEPGSIPSLESDIQALDKWERNDSHYKVLHQAILQRLTNSRWVAQIVASHLATVERLCDGARTTTHSAKVQKGFFNFANAKAITVDVSFAPISPAFRLLSSNLYFDKAALCAESEFEVSDRQTGAININPSDNVVIAVKGLGLLTDALLLMPQLALYEIIQQIPQPSELPNPMLP